ncbi:hypothetical protein GPECTOR_9g622 [Gonium pectorale]|uniref:Uncharacterized protein n=1 Tax=Gonium pectorale TaxID=33097 RepID=A0A150GSB0_GONPE|nr:hypothetical protein GPECTOR_9g622 [Gonium pectorale]|eukprot:KXZ52578.1 hypothetical protein GPECTOR_9g622 [Gonium pectorale]
MQQVEVPNPLHTRNAQQWFVNLPDDTARAVMNTRRSMVREQKIMDAVLTMSPRPPAREPRPTTEQVMMQREAMRRYREMLAARGRGRPMGPGQRPGTAPPGGGGTQAMQRLGVKLGLSQPPTPRVGDPGLQPGPNGLPPPVMQIIAAQQLQQLTPAQQQQMQMQQMQMQMQQQPGQQQPDQAAPPQGKVAARGFPPPQVAAPPLGPPPAMDLSDGGDYGLAADVAEADTGLAPPPAQLPPPLQPVGARALPSLRGQQPLPPPPPPPPAPAPWGAGGDPFDVPEQPLAPTTGMGFPPPAQRSPLLLPLRAPAGAGPLPPAPPAPGVPRKLQRRPSEDDGE